MVNKPPKYTPFARGDVGRAVYARLEYIKISPVHLRRYFLWGSVSVFLAFWSWPLWWAHNRWGVFDWNTSSQRVEAMRATIIEFHQWPGNNPWMTGGVPLLGNPMIGTFSLPSIFSLLVGTHWGLHLSCLLLIGIGFSGAWLLSRIWWSDRWLRILFSLYVVANPAMIYHATAGHLAFLNYYFLPAILYFFLRYDQDRWSGLKAGLLMSAAFLHSVAYIVQYAFLIFSPLLLWHYWRRSPPKGDRRPCPLEHTLPSQFFHPQHLSDRHHSTGCRGIPPRLENLLSLGLGHCPKRLFHSHDWLRQRGTQGFLFFCRRGLLLPRLHGCAIVHRWPAKWISMVACRHPDPDLGFTGK